MDSFWVVERLCWVSTLLGLVALPRLLVVLLLLRFVSRSRYSGFFFSLGGTLVTRGAVEETLAYGGAWNVPEGTTGGNPRRRNRTMNSLTHRTTEPKWCFLIRATAAEQDGGERRRRRPNERRYSTVGVGERCFFPTYMDEFVDHVVRGEVRSLTAANSHTQWRINTHIPYLKKSNQTMSLYLNSLFWF